jgi:tRNA pseudouridine13 synthase
MKLKQTPEDFRVEECTDVTPGSHGPFAYYNLSKQNWTTPDALGVVRERWKIEPRRVSYGGLKDRHADTTQYLTIEHGPRRNLAQQGLAVTYLGQLPRPYTSHDIRANRFVLVLRDLKSDEADFSLAALERVRSDGVPNYFDDQRFGSVSGGGEFVAKFMVLGRFEDALKEALTAPYDFDRPPQKREKATLLAHWGDWAACRKNLERGHAHSLAEYLCHRPGDFRGALERLRPELRGLYLAAYQSEIWNRMLALLLRRIVRPEQLREVVSRRGPVPFPRELDSEQRQTLAATTLPLPSARLKLAAGDPHAELIASVLAEEGFSLEKMKVRGSRDLFFSRGDRPALCLPRDLQVELSEDDRHRGRKKMILGCELPRGSYATLIVKRMAATPLPLANPE